MHKKNTPGAKKIVLSVATFASLLWSSPVALVFAATITLGLISPTSVVNDNNGGDVSWSAPQNATSTNSISSGITIVSNGNTTSQILRASGYDLSSVPNSATILGVTLSVIKSGSIHDKDLTTELVSGSTVSANKAATTTAWSSPFFTTTYGGPADTWGLALTPAIIKASDFGVIFAVKRTGNNNPPYPNVDSMLLTVTYSAIVDVTAPVISGVPANMTVEAVSAAGATTTYSLPTALDAVDGVVAVSCLPVSGSTFSLGATTVTCNTSDAAGNTSSAIFTVTVVDTTAPMIAAHATVTAEATSATGATVLYTAPNATDAVDSSFVATCSAPSGSVFVIGNTTVTCNATDTHGNIATPTTFTITVQDTTAPIISSMPSAITIEAQDGSGATVTYANPIANDLIDGAVAVSCVPPSGSVFALGDTTVTCSSTDAALNTATSSFHIIVQDSTAPVLVLPGNITTEAVGPSGATVTFAPTATDLVDNSLPVICTPASGSVFPLGTTAVSCSATDTALNTTSGSFNITIVDTTGPAVSIAPTTQTIEADNSLGAIANYIASAVDIVDGSLASACSPLSGSVFAIGTTTVSCSATDMASNTGSSTATVIVRDTTPPIITPPANQTFQATGATTTPALVMATATDTVDAAPVITYDIHDFLLGDTAVTWTATDTSGNTTATTSQVTITPVPAPAPAPTPVGGGGGGVVSGILSFGFQNNLPPAPAPTTVVTTNVPPTITNTPSAAEEAGSSALEQINSASPDNTATRGNESVTNNNNGGAGSGGNVTTSTATAGSGAKTNNTNNLAALAAGSNGSFFSGWSWWWILILIALASFGRWLYKKYSEKETGKKVTKNL
jgi:hypothetical protein